MTALAQEIDHRLQRVPPAQARRLERLIRELLELADPADDPAPPTHRPAGLCAGQFTVPDDFDAPLPDALLDTFDAL